MPPATLAESPDVLERLRDAATYLTTFDRYAQTFDRAGLEPGDIDSIEAFRQLPTMAPADLAEDYLENPPFGSLVPPDRSIVRCNFTPNPHVDQQLPVVSTREDIELNTAVNAAAYRSIGVTDDDVVLNTTDMTPFPFGWAVQGAAERIGATHLPMGPGETDRKVETIETYDVTTICGFPSYILEIADAAPDGSLESVERIIASGEPFTAIDGYRETVRDAFGGDVTVVDGYGLSEFGTGFVACESRLEAGMHLFTEKVFPEVIDPETGELVERGEKGELVLTSLAEESAPVCRLRTGDLTKLTKRDTDYGDYLLPEGVFGRTDDMRKIKGVKVFPSELRMHLAGVPGVDAEHVQFVLARPHGTTDELTIRLAADPDDVDRDDLHEEIRGVIGISADELVIDPSFEVDGEIVIDER